LPPFAQKINDLLTIRIYFPLTSQSERHRKHGL
jgi:hypothetical protein